MTAHTLRGTAFALMPTLIARDVDRTLVLLRRLIRDSRETPYSIQEQCSWGLATMAQIFSKHRRLRLDELLQILYVIRIPPGAFFAAVFGTTGSHPEDEPTDSTGKLDKLFAEHGDLEGLRRVLDETVRLLEEHGHITDEDTAALYDLDQEDP